MRIVYVCALCGALCGPVAAATLLDQQPVTGGGVSRWSQLWQDPIGDNDLDGDSVSWADFTLTQPATISHLEWWGTGACELGFQIEFWRQDPGTVAYQPISVFYYGGSNPRPSPEPPGFIRAIPAASPGPDGLTHYLLDLPAPVTLAANDSANPRWFIGIVGLTHLAYYTWNWAQAVTTTTHTFQFIRGGYHGGGDVFRSLGDGRALLLADALPEPMAGDYNRDGSVDAADFVVWRTMLGQSAAGLAADGDQNGTVNAADYALWLASFGNAGGGNAVPEPLPIGLLLFAPIPLSLHRARRIVSRRADTSRT
jgi:hypothetical protein